MEKWMLIYDTKCKKKKEAEEAASKIDISIDDQYDYSQTGTKENKRYLVRYIIEADNESEAKEKGIKANAPNCVFKEAKQIEYLDGNEVKKIIKHTEFDSDNTKPKILILGTRITKKSIEAGYYYLGVENNPFWRILSKVFDKPNFIDDHGNPNSLDQIIDAQRKHNVVVSDLIYSCYCAGSSDEETIVDFDKYDITNPVCNYSDLGELISKADLVILNGGFSCKKKKTGTLNFLHTFYKTVINSNKNKVFERGYIIVNKKSTNYISLPSTSESNTTANEAKKIDAWKREISRELTLIK